MIIFKFQLIQDITKQQTVDPAHSVLLYESKLAQLANEPDHEQANIFLT